VTGMRDAFKGFVVLRLVGLLAVLVVGAGVFAVRSFVRGGDVAGAGFLVGGLVCAVAIRSLLAGRATRRGR
jgi:predicted transporter